MAAKDSEACSLASRAITPASITSDVISISAPACRESLSWSILLSQVYNCPNNTDKVIGLKLTVAKSKDSDKRFYSDLSGNQLNITSGDPSDGSMEVVINKGLGKTMAGMFYTVDGFYLIKSGGSHAGGALSYGALPVDEATIRLNPKIRLISRKF